MSSDLIIVIGAYGSGKSEYAINLAEQYKNRGEEVFLVDLDVVNPYFRSRDVREYFAGIGITVISPDGEFAYADLPMISPKIAGAVSQKDKVVILDVGGDAAGCRALARFTQAIKDRGYGMHFVVNTLRPFTGNTEDVIGMMNTLERASKLQITELISNTNLLDETETAAVEKGVQILNEVASVKRVAFDTYLVLDKMKGEIADGIGGKRRMILHYYLQKPWEMLNMKGV